MQTDSLMLERIGASWYEQLEHFIESDKFQRIRRFLIEESQTKVIYPSAELAYEAFRLCPYDKTKVVIIGQDPYHDGSANGLAFSTYGKLTPSLRVILDEVKREYSMNVYRSTSLHDWARQGVLLLNTALSVQAKNAGSHLHIWTEFTQHVVDTLKNKDFLVWMLWGNAARDAVKEVPKNHVILQTVHPAAVVYDNTTRKFVPEFKLCNEYLTNMGLSGIDWNFDLDDLPF